MAPLSGTDSGIRDGPPLRISSVRLSFIIRRREEGGSSRIEAVLVPRATSAVMGEGDRAATQALEEGGDVGHVGHRQLSGVEPLPVEVPALRAYWPDGIVPVQESFGSPRQNSEHMNDQIGIELVSSIEDTEGNNAQLPLSLRHTGRRHVERLPIQGRFSSKRRGDCLLRRLAAPALVALVTAVLLGVSNGASADSEKGEGKMEGAERLSGSKNGKAGAQGKGGRRGNFIRSAARGAARGAHMGEAQDDVRVGVACQAANGASSPKMTVLEGLGADAETGGRRLGQMIGAAIRGVTRFFRGG
eukprot:evm.model.scf_76.16 EVM.evm.TU.scf_76.16   scf_76:113707-114921(-)